MFDHDVADQGQDLHLLVDRDLAVFLLVPVEIGDDSARKSADRCEMARAETMLDGERCDGRVRFFARFKDKSDRSQAVDLVKERSFHGPGAETMQKPRRSTGTPLKSQSAHVPCVFKKRPGHAGLVLSGIDRFFPGPQEEAG